MPNYEYTCNKCGETFSATMSLSDHDRFMTHDTNTAVVMTTSESPIRCPKCQGIDLRQQLSGFFAKTSRKS